MRKQVVVVGAGMVGHRFAEELVARDRRQQWDVHLVGAEEYEPYNRILLSDVLARRCDLAALTLPRPPERVQVRRGVHVTSLNRAGQQVNLDDGTVLDYDHVVLATGATPFVPPIAGLGDDAPEHVHVLRTIDDCREVVARTVNARHAVVLGGGLLGLEAACGLARRGLAVTVVHLDDHLMADQVDPEAGHVLAASLEALGVRVVTGTSVTEVVGAYGELVAVRLTDGAVLATDLLLVSCGVRPDVGLAREAGLPTGRGITVTEALASPEDARVHAVGDCAEPPSGVTGLVGPGWRQAERLAASLTGGAAPAPVDDLPEGVRLKAVGVELVTRGARRSTASPEDRVVALSDPQGGRLVEVVVRGERLVGFTALGAARVAAELAVAFDRRTPLPLDPAALLLPHAGSGEQRAAAGSPTLIPADATICRCNGVTKAEIVEAWEGGCRDVAGVAAATRATTGCGGCTDTVCGLVDWLTASDGPGESAPQPVRNTGATSVAETKHRTATDEMQHS